MKNISEKGEPFLLSKRQTHGPEGASFKANSGITVKNKVSFVDNWLGNCPE